MARHPPGHIQALLPVTLLPILATLIGAALGEEAALVAYVVVAEVLAAFGTALESALEHHSRTGVLLLADQRGDRTGVEARLRLVPSYLVTARLSRSLGNVLLIVGLAWWLLGAGASATGWLWPRIAGALGAGFALSFLINDLLVRAITERNSDRFLLGALGPASVLHALLAPVRMPVVLLVHLLLGVRLDEAKPDARTEILETVGEAEREGRFTPEEAGMVESIMSLHRLSVGDILVPRADVVMLQADTPLDEAVKVLNEEGYSRIPVYGRDRDDVVGLLYARDLLTRWRDAAPESRPTITVRMLMREPYFVPQGKSATDLLQEMRRRKTHLAVVLDEFNGTAGVVSIEDLLEQIVGQIQDEYDQEELDAPAPQPRSDGTMEIEGRMSIEDINRLFALDLPLEDDFETIGGLVFHRLGRVPIVGDEVSVGRALLRVLQADDRTAQRLALATLEGDPPSIPVEIQA